MQTLLEHTASDATVEPPRRAVRSGVGLRRVAAALPPMLGSTALVAIVLSAVPGGGALLLLVWLAAGLLALTRRGERAAVRLWCDFRRPTPGQRQALAQLSAEASTRAAVESGRIDWYVVRCERVNAHAIGARSVAVTSRLIADDELGRLPHPDVVALLVHELGHLSTGGVRYGLLTDWFAAPWRRAARLVVLGPARLLGYGGHPRLVVGVLAVGVMTAIARGIAQHAWLGVTVLGGASILAVLVPLAEAAASRSAERAADQFTADRGLAVDLSRALGRFSDSDSGDGDGCVARAFRRHPALADRIDALLASASDRTGAWPTSTGTVRSAY